VLRFIYIFLILVNLILLLPIFVVDSNVPTWWLLVVVLEVTRAAGLGGGWSSIELDNSVKM
jgi:hypothetical protein